MQDGFEPLNIAILNEDQTFSSWLASKLSNHHIHCFEHVAALEQHLSTHPTDLLLSDAHVRATNELEECETYSELDVFTLIERASPHIYWIILTDNPEQIDEQAFWRAEKTIKPQSHFLTHFLQGLNIKTRIQFELEALEFDPSWMFTDKANQHWTDWYSQLETDSKRTGEDELALHPIEGRVLTRIDDSPSALYFVQESERLQDALTRQITRLSKYLKGSMLELQRIHHLRRTMHEACAYNIGVDDGRLRARTKP